jgi:putative flavoprotein involved in K+ transport
MTHVVIIGAGPAGLAAAACLGERGISYTLLERGDAVAAGLRRVDPEMRLFSPARLSRLPGMQAETGGERYAPFGAFVAALDGYARARNITATTRAEVTSVERAGEGFAVRCRQAGGTASVHTGSHVINATGIVCAPRLPDDFDPARAPAGGRWMHSLDARAADLQQARRLLVVGGGASAAEVLAIWLRVRQPDDQAWISLRSPLRAIPHFVLGLDTHYLSWLPEHLPARPFGPWFLSKDAMFGTEVPRAIRAGAIQQVPGVARYEPDGVVLTDGRKLQPDLLVLATGFRHVTSHLGDLVERDAEGWPLARGAESARTPRLHLLGSRFARTLASPYLRGIARDARFVARRIARGA